MNNIDYIRLYTATYKSLQWSPRALALYVYLCFYVEDDGRLLTTTKKVAADLGFKPRMANALLNSLARTGKIKLWRGPPQGINHIHIPNYQTVGAAPRGPMAPLPCDPPLRLVQTKREGEPRDRIR